MDPARCEICGATAYRYKMFGVPSCRGCQTFFRYNKNLESESRKLVCRLRWNCELTPESRQSCPACRFKKCLEVGMKKGEPYNPHSCLPTPKSPIDTSFSSLASRILADAPEVTEQIVQAHKENCDYTDAKMEVLMIIKLDLLPSIKDSLIKQLNAWQIFSSEVARDIHQTISFLDEQPQFKKLDVEDQALLLKNSYFMVFLIRISSGLSDEGLHLPGGRLIDITAFKLLYGCLTKRMLQFAKNLAELLTDGTTVDKERALFIMLVISQTGMGKFKNPLEVIDVSVYYEGIIQWAIEESETYQKLTGMLHGLQELNKSHDKMLDFVRQYTQHLDLPPIFVEMFNIN